MLFWKIITALFIKLTRATGDVMKNIGSKTFWADGKGLLRNGKSKPQHLLTPGERFAETKGLTKVLRYRRHRRSIKVAAFLMVAGAWLLFWWHKFWFETASENPRAQCISNASAKKDNATKRILLWNGTQRKEIRAFGIGRKVFAEKGCALTQCEISAYRWGYAIDYYDAVIVIFNDEFLSQEDMMMPEFSMGRNPDQRLIFFTQESPPALRSHYNMTSFNNYFNWTMTYMKNSDIPLLYGRIVPKASAPRTPGEVAQLRHEARRLFRNRPNSLIRRKRKKKVAWMVSHCLTYSMRELYVMELKKYINVDVYGRCGNLTCAVHDLHSSDPQCYDMLQSNYKFYLAFENSLCEDYVTEKFFKIMAHDIIPVVYGGADYTKYAPPHSYINAGKFKPKELAAYLNLLDANDTLYNEYFWWKDHYRVESSIEDMSRHGFCGLCQKLHEDSSYKSYPEMSTDWGDESERCA
ncbi:putative Alpha--fucosyltransferase C [Daphnia magna]|uniref:Fucosyltransferase n=1 Tax=Daphnia magna TaxID=35525 RepID=A0A0N8CYB3_9CRUS|nr:putative Alpha--fucosyltransferase C [Daphnia magna]